MAEIAVVVTTINTFVTIASKVLDLGDRYYKASAAWDDFKLKVGNLSTEAAVWKETFRNHGIISDPALIGILNRATSMLEKENKKLVRREQSKRRRRWYKVQLLAFPEEAGRRIQNVVDAFKAIPDHLRLRDDAKAVIEKELLNRPHSLPFRIDERYVPLEETEEKIYSKLKDSTVVLLYGGPGQGKSTLAQHVALHCETTLLFDQVIFLECGLEVKTSVKRLELLKKLGVSINEEKQQSTFDSTMIHQLKFALKDRKILIIFDDVWEGSFVQEMTYLCGDKVKCLVTTQRRDLCANWGCPSLQKVPIEDTSMEVGRRILAAYVGFPNQDIPSKQIMDVVDKIVRATEGNPLALVRVASAISDYRKNDPSEWEEAYGNFKQLLQREMSGKYPGTVFSATQLSVESLKEGARMMLILVHLCKGPSIPEEVIHFLHRMIKFQGQGQTFQISRNELEDRGILKITTPVGDEYRSEISWSTHSITKLYMEEDSDMQEKKKDMFESLIASSSSLDLKSNVGSEISTEFLQDDDARVTTLLCALYFEDQFAAKAASQLSIRDDRLNNLRRKAFEPITRLLTHRTSAAQTAAKQVFIEFFYKCKVDQENTCMLLMINADPSVQLKTLAAMVDLHWINETPLLESDNKLLSSLVTCLSNNNAPILQENATAMLRKLAFLELNRLQILNVNGALQGLVNALCALPSLENKAHSSKIKVQEEAGALSGQVSSLSNQDNPGLKENAAAALANLAYGDESSKLKVLEEAGALSGLVSSLSNLENPGLQEQAARALRNLTSGGKSSILKVQEEASILSGLVSSLSNQDNPGLKENAAAALANLACGDESSKLKVLEEVGALSGLVSSLSNKENPGLQEQAARALQNLTSGAKSSLLKVQEEAGALSGLVSSLSNQDNPGLQEKAAGTLANLACGDESSKLKVLEEPGALSGLVSSLNQANPHFQEEATRALQNLTIGAKSSMLKVQEEAGALLGLVSSLSNQDNPGLKENAAAALAILACGDESSELKVVEEVGALSGLVSSLSNDENPGLQEQAPRGAESSSGLQVWGGSGGDILYIISPINTWDHNL